MPIEDHDPFTGTSPFNRTELLNEMASIVQRVMKMTGGPGILLQNSDGGITIATIDEDGDEGGSSGGGMFAVLVQWDGFGNSGSATEQCSYTYDVRSLNGQELGKGLSPLKNRSLFGKYTAPTRGDFNVYGTGFYTGDGTFRLYDANEVYSTEECA
jgi:hypothetical protein